MVHCSLRAAGTHLFVDGKSPGISASVVRHGSCVGVLVPATSGGSEAILKLRALHTNGDWDQTVTRLGPRDTAAKSLFHRFLGRG